MNAPSPRKSFVSIAIVGAAGVLAAGPALADIKIGFNVPLTGFAAADGQSSLNGAKLAVAQAMGGAAATESKDIVITSPDIAENGAVVPFTISSRLPTRPRSRSTTSRSSARTAYRR